MPVPMIGMYYARGVKIVNPENPENPHKISPGPGGGQVPFVAGLAEIRREVALVFGTGVKRGLAGFALGAVLGERLAGLLACAGLTFETHGMGDVRRVATEGRPYGAVRGFGHVSIRLQQKKIPPTKPIQQNTHATDPRTKY